MQEESHCAALRREIDRYVCLYVCICVCVCVRVGGSRDYSG